MSDIAATSVGSPPAHPPQIPPIQLGDLPPELGSCMWWQECQYLIEHLPYNGKIVRPR
ncbi:hypothetical protein ACQP1G_14415 [Nocardia sp. CA-107356]|uniref:hypothetical protein n=1 Tax=Nocardia sp. CA-107356 TaxID=3239972 RepID=UPI003D93B244